MAQPPEDVGMHGRIVERMEAKGLKPGDVARDLHIDTRTVLFWTKGEHEPKRERRRELAELLGVRDEWLRTGEGPRDLPVEGPPDPDQMTRIERRLDEIESEQRNLGDELRELRSLRAAVAEIKDETLTAIADLVRRFEGDSGPGTPPQSP
jgi:transcriptional regulator with XRE-family HTH domain